jgi:hypothetical protein
VIQRTFQQAVDQYGMEFKNEAELRKAVSQGDGDMSQIDAMLEKQPAPADKESQKPEPVDKAKKRSVELKVADKRPKPKYKKKDGTLKSTKDAEAVNKRFSDAVAEASKKITPRNKAKLEAQVKKSEDRREGAPPIVTPEDYARQSPTMSAQEHAAQLQHIGEQNVGEDNLRSHLESAGVYEASPKQLKQFAQMLGIDVWGAVTTPEQLRAAIDVHGKHENLYAILRKNGLMSQEPETTPSFSEAAGTALSERVGGAVSDFVTGFKQTSPIGLARTAMRSVGRGLAGPVGEAVASNLTRRDRNQAVDKYEPGYEPMQVNAIPPPKAKPKPSPRAFTARTNDPNADFWITRRGSMETVGRPHKEFAPESIGITVNKEHLDPTYAYYMMQHLHGQGHWKQHATGTTNLVNIRTKHLKQLADQLTPEPEPLPPVQGPIPPLPKEKPAEQSYGEKEVARIQETTKDPEQFAGEADEQPGIVMPSDDVSNEDASQGDQLGLFGEGKKKKVPKKYKQDNPQGKARAKSLFDKDEDPDQQTLFSSWGEAVEYYSMQKKK